MTTIQQMRQSVESPASQLYDTGKQQHLHNASMWAGMVKQDIDRLLIHIQYKNEALIDSHIAYMLEVQKSLNESINSWIKENDK